MEMYKNERKMKKRDVLNYGEIFTEKVNEEN